MSDRDAVSFYKYRAKVVRVIDGDTLDLAIDLGFNVTMRERVRLYGVNTPETHGVAKDSEEYAKGQKAVAYVQDFVQTNPTVIVATYKDRKEKFGRYLAQVYADDGTCLNDQLLANGLAASTDNKGNPL